MPFLRGTSQTRPQRKVLHGVGWSMDIMPIKSLASFILFGGLILGAAVHNTHAIGKGGSCDAIIGRNAFHLNARPIDLPPMAPPVNTIKLIGLSTVGGRSKVFL